MVPIVLPMVRRDDYGHRNDTGIVVEDPDPSDLSAAFAECIIRTAVEHHARCERRRAVPSGSACQKADDSPGNGNGTMTGETQSDSYSLEKGPAAATFAKIVSACMRLLVLRFVTTSCLGEMGCCDKHCLTTAGSNSSDCSRAGVLLQVFSCLGS